MSRSQVADYRAQDASDLPAVSLIRSVVITAIGMLLGMGGFELLVEPRLASDTIVNLLTILFSTFVACFVAYFVAHRYQRVQRERVLAVAALQRSEMQLAEAQTLARVGSWTAEIATGKEDWSDELYRIYGLEPHGEAATFATFLRFVHPEDRARVSTFIEQTNRQAGTFNHEYRIVRPDGAVRWIADHAQVVGDAQGRPAWVVGASQDITERKQAEQQQQESAERYRQMFEGNRSVQWLIDPVSGAIVEANAAAADFYGYPVDELQHMSITDINISLDLQTFREVAQGVAQTPSNLLYRHKLASGEIRDVEIHSGPIDVSGRRLLYSIIHDVTARKQAEDALVEAAARYRLMFTATPVPMWVFNKETFRFLEVNEAATAHYGYSRDEFLAMTVADLRLAEDRPGLPELVQGLVVNANGRWQGRHRLKDGRMIDVEVAQRYLSHEKPASILAVITDVSAQRLAAAAREERIRAEQASQAKSDFLSRMSHELRTPLNAILGFAQVLERDRLGELQQESVEQILRGGRHLLALVNDVLDITGVESGRLVVSLGPVDLDEVVDEAITLSAPVAGPCGVTIHSSLDPLRGHYVRADMDRLRQVVVHLLDNAIKYNRRGGSVSVACTAVQGGQRLEVQDTGPGIAPDQLARLFTPFERLHADQTMIEGTGLGLALVKRLMDAMEGRIGVESVVGEGSTFWIELPVAAPSLETMNGAAA